MARIVEVEEDGTLILPSDVLDNAKPHTQFVVEANGSRLTLRPVQAKSEETKKPNKKRATKEEKWEEERRQLSEELGKVWPKGVSVVDVISDMRR